MSSLAWYAVPGNASDAGPDTRNPEPPPDFDDLCVYAEDELRDARRLYRDDKAVQRKLRADALRRAQDHIAAALALLEAEA